MPENTVAEFLTAAEELSRDHDVVIVGSSGYGGDLDARARALSAANPRIRWLGHVSDDDRLHSLWQHAGAYFHGHSVGGTNPALVQAMACGAPIVARDTVFNRETLGQDAGMLTPIDPRSIAYSMRDLLASPDAQERLSAHAIRRVRERYTWQSVGEAYEASLLGAIASSRRGRA